jgi:hypothetical protein
MPLIDLKTNLKSLRFGNDRPGNLSSANARGAFAAFPNGVDPIIPPNEDEDQGVQGFTSSNEFGIRGGLLRVGVALDDVERLFKLYTKTNVGLSFNAKQIAQGLLADPTQAWNPFAVSIQSGLNIPGVGHYPAFFNPSPESFGDFLNPLALGPTDLRSVSDSNPLKPGESDGYRMGNPAFGTNPLLKGTLLGNPIGTPIRRKRGVKDGKQLFNVVYTRKEVGDPIPETTDKMAMKPLYTSVGGEDGVDYDMSNSDFIKFRISVVNNNNPSERTWITFRAFIDSFSDSYGADWGKSKFVGRGESFYTYGGFNRDISLGFRIAVQSRQEQKPLYKKITYLASLCAPDYSEAGFMRGNLIYLTVGDYLVDVPGVLQGLSFGGFEQSPWETAKKADGTPLDPEEAVAQLPHTLTVSGFKFSPIHNFVPQKGSKFIGYDIANPTGIIYPEQHYGFSVADYNEIKPILDFQANKS